jgi:DNA-binding NarL/FixJ family response regulator
VNQRTPERPGRQVSAPPTLSAVVAAGSPVRVATMSDSALFRSGLRRFIGTDRSFSIVTEITAPPARDVIRATSPHLLLVDAQMECAFAVCADLRQAGARPWVILAGANGDERWAVQALKSGARGILSKSAGGETLLKALRVVHQGQVWAGYRVIALAIDELAAEASAPPVTASALRSRLSPREQQVVHLIVRGFSNLEVAGRLGITEATVKAHLTHIFQKLALRGRGQLAARYHQSFGQSFGPGLTAPGREPDAMPG